MRRIALALAVAVLGSGCIINADDTGSGAAELFWQFRNYDGAVAGDWTSANDGCADAGVTDVRVELWRGDALVYDEFHPCEDVGAVVNGLREGTYEYWLTGYRLNDPVFRANAALAVADDRVTEVAETLDVLASVPLTLYYTQNGTFSCAGTPSVYYAVYDGAALEDSNEIPCDPNAFGFSLPRDLPVGSIYDVDFMQLLGSDGFARYERCGVGVRHTGFPVVVNLLPAPQASCDFL